MRKRDNREKHKHREQDEIELISLSNEENEYRKRITEEEVHKPRRKKNKTENREFARVTYFFVGLFLFMMGYLVYFNVFKAKDIINSSYNVRLDSMKDRVVRGEILDRDGTILATNLTYASLVYFLNLNEIEFNVLCFCVSCNVCIIVKAYRNERC